MDDVEQIVLDMVTKVFSEEFEHGDLQRSAGGSFLADKWQVVEALGLPEALVGGAGSDLGLETRSALKIVRLMAYHAIPLPLAETMFANYLLDRAGLPTRTSPMTIAPSHRLDALTLTELPGGGWKLRGSARAVPYARHAEAIVVLAKHSSESYLAIVESACWRTREYATSLTGVPADGLVFDTDLPADALARLPSSLDAEIILLGGAALRAIGLAGALERILDLTVAFVGDRVQFGRQLGKFQAIQHGVAQLAGQSVAAGAAADLAAEAFAANCLMPGIAVAKSRTGEAAGIVASLAHQIHGAIGVTDEYKLQHLTKQAWAWRDEFGNEAFWNERLGRHFLAARADGLWPAITSI